MKHHLIPLVAAAAFAMAPAALADCSTLEVSVTGSLETGGAVVLELSGAPAMAPTWLLIGQNAGSTVVDLGSLGMLELGLEFPFSVLPLGSTGGDGSLTVDFTYPAVPAAVGTFEAVLQAVSVGIEFGQGPPELTACASNTATLTLE